MKNLEKRLCELETIFTEEEINLAREIIACNNEKYQGFEEDLFQIVIEEIWQVKKENALIDDTSIVERVESNLAWSREQLESFEANIDNLEYSIDINMDNDLFDTLKCELKRICSSSSDEMIDRNTNIMIDVLSGISIQDVAESYEMTKSNVHYIMRRYIEKIRLKCLKVFASDEQNHKLLEQEVEEYYGSDEYARVRRNRKQTAEERRILQLNKILTGSCKYTSNDKRTHENISDLAVVYQKQLPKRIG